MNIANFVIQGKGGVGKSFVAWVIGQYGLEKWESTYYADLDPTNASFHRYPALNAEHINISKTDKEIDRRRFDDVVDALCLHEGFSLVDTGAPTFLPLMSYITENKTFELLEDQGRDVYIHTPIVGGPAMEQTLVGLQSILQSCPGKVVIWENEYFGAVDIDGKRIVETQLYKKHQDRIAGVIKIAKYPADTLAVDIKTILEKRMVLADGKTAGFRIPAQNRIENFKRDMFDQLERVGL